MRLQALLPFNPAEQSAVAQDLSFNTAISFITNTNWQNYGGESTLSYLVQMLGLTHQNFLSAATGIALAVALIRGFSRSSMRTIGNFWVDVTRCTLYVLLPICVVAALFLVSQGMPQTLGAYVDATTLEGAKQTIAVGPVASQVAIKMLGTNGGGFFNANAAHPFENPTALSNFVQMILIFALGAAMTNVFGRMVGNQRQGCVANFGFTGQLGLLQVGHANHVHAPGTIDVRFGHGRKRGPFHTDIGSASMRFDFSNLAGLLEHIAHVFADRMGKSNMGHYAVTEERRFTSASPGAIKELIGNHHVEWRVLFLQRTNRRRRKDTFHPEQFHAVNVGAEVDF
jgi:hypothetical protein